MMVALFDVFKHSINHRHGGKSFTVLQIIYFIHGSLHVIRHNIILFPTVTAVFKLNARNIGNQIRFSPHFGYVAVTRRSVIGIVIIMLTTASVILVELFNDQRTLLRRYHYVFVITVMLNAVAVRLYFHLHELNLVLDIEKRFTSFNSRNDFVVVGNVATVYEHRRLTV